MDLKDRIQQAMDLRKVNKTQLAKLVGVTPQAAQKWLARGDDGTIPRMPKIKQIARALQVSESWLIAGVGVPDDDEEKRRLLIEEINDLLNESDSDDLARLLSAAKEIKRS